MMGTTRLLACGLAVCLGVCRPVRAGCRELSQRDTLQLYSSGLKVGVLVHAMHGNADGTVTDSAVFDAAIVPGPGARTVQVRIAEYRRYGKDGRLTRQSREIGGASGVSRWEMHRTAPGHWVVTSVLGGEAIERTVADSLVTDRVDQLCAVYQGMRGNSLRRGSEWVDTTYDIASGKQMVTRVWCTGTPSEGGDGYWVFAGRDEYIGRDVRWVVDTAGRTMLRSLPPLFEGRHVGFRSGSAVPAGQGIPLTERFRVPALRAAAAGEILHLSLKDGVQLPESAEGFYTRRNGGYDLKALLASCPRGGVSDLFAGVDSALVAPTPVLQVAHPRVRSLADSIAPGDVECCTIVAELCAYVRKSLSYRHTAAHSSALETLEAGFGDCSEHAVLLAALLRVRGIPARVVNGLVYVHERKAYLGHAWVGIPIAGGWLFADPTSGQFPAGRGLVPILIDDSGTDAMVVLRLYDRMSISYRKPG